MLAREIVAAFHSPQEAVKAEEEFERIFEKKNYLQQLRKRKLKKRK